jgi:hypothetical protein
MARILDALGYGRVGPEVYAWKTGPFANEMMTSRRRIKPEPNTDDVDLFKEAPGWCMHVYGVGEALKRGQAELADPGWPAGLLETRPSFRIPIGSSIGPIRKKTATTRKKTATTRKTQKRTPGKARKRAGKTVKALRSP